MQKLDTAHLTLIHNAKCPKLSNKASGQLVYSIWLDAESQETFISLTENENGGYFSSELLPLAKIIDHLAILIASNKPFPASSLQPIFVGKSANNPSFLAAVLKDQSILETEPSGLRFHNVSTRVHDWQSELIKLWHTRHKTAIPQKDQEPKSSSNQTKVSKGQPPMSDIQT